jgi:hypothetical protein
MSTSPRIVQDLDPKPDENLQKTPIRHQGNRENDLRRRTSTTVQSVYDYDREEHPVTGSEEIDAIVVKRVDAYTHEATLTHGSQEMGAFRRVISKDGRHMTVTFKRRNPPVDYVEVYEKSEQE